MKKPIWILMALSLMSSAAHAGLTIPHLPNNTQTWMSSQVPRDAGLMVLEGYLSRHLYGTEAVLLLDLADLGYQKEIYAVVNGGQRTHRALFVRQASDLASGGAWAFWMGKSGGRERIVIKLPVFTGDVAPERLVIDLYVKIGGRQLESHSIRFSRGVQ